MMLPRKALLSRVERVDPTLIRLIAPAGYGKSVLAQQLALNRPHLLVPSIHELDDDALAQRAHDWERMPERSRLIVWATEIPPEDKERIESFLAAMLSRRPQDGTMIAISRTTLHFHERHLAPHEILTFTTHELRFSNDEIGEIFDGENGVRDESLIRAVAEYSDGWPIVVLFLRRLHREGRLEAYLENPRDDRSSDDLLDHLDREVFSLLDERCLRALVFACAINELGVDDAAQRGWYANEQAAFSVLRERGLIRRIFSKIEVISIVRHLVALREPAAYREAFSFVAARLLNEGELMRAAEAYLAGGNQQSAAAVLTGIVDDNVPYDVGRFEAAARQISPVLLSCHRSLWWKTIGVAWEPAVLPFNPHEDTVAGLLVKAQSLPRPHANALRFATAMLAISRGSPINAKRILRSLVEESQNEPERFRAYAYVALAGTASFLSRHERAHEYLQQAQEIFPEADTVFCATRFMVFAREVFFSNTMTERWPQLQRLYDVVVTHKAPNGVIRCVIMLGNAAIIRGHASIVDFAKREMTMLAPIAPERARPYLDLWSTGRLPEDAGGSRGIVDALTSAVVHMQLGNREEAREALRIARDRAVAIDQENVSSLVDEIEASLSAFVALPVLENVVPFPEPREEIATDVSLSVHSGVLTIDANDLLLPQRSVQLLVYLAMCGRPVSREELAEALWPELGERSQMNAVKSCVHRTRALIGPAHHVLVSERGGYSVRGLSIDLFQAERVLTSPDEAPVASLLAAARALTIGLPSHITQLEPFAALTRRVALAAERAWIELGERALTEHDNELLLSAVNELTLLDSLNEESISLLIRWHVQHDRRDEAYRVFQKYRAMLLDELSAPPSERLAKLLEA